MRELDAKIMLKKIRDSHDLLKNMIENDYLQYLQYHRERIVDLDEDSLSDVEDVSDEEEKQAELYKEMTVKESMRLAIIRGMRLDPTQKNQLKDAIKKKDLKGRGLELWSKLGNMDGEKVNQKAKKPKGFAGFVAHINQVKIINNRDTELKQNDDPLRKTDSSATKLVKDDTFIFP